MYLRNYLRKFPSDVRAQKLRLFLTVFGLASIYVKALNKVKER